MEAKRVCCYCGGNLWEISKGTFWCIDCDIYFKDDGEYISDSAGNMHKVKSKKGGKKKRKRAKKHFWTEAEDKIIMEHVNTCTTKEIADILNLHYGIVQKRTMKILGKKPYVYGKDNLRNNAWSKEEESFLINNKDRYTIEEFAEKLGRSTSAIYQRRHKLNITEPKSRRQEF